MSLANQLQDRAPNLDVKLSGIVMMNNAFGESAQEDSATLVPLMFVIVIITLFGLLLRSVTGTISSVLVIAMSILVTMGLFGWAGFDLTSPTISAPTIILTMAVADCVHILVTFLTAMRNGLTKHEATVEPTGEYAAGIYYVGYHRARLYEHELL